MSTRFHFPSSWQQLTLTLCTLLIPVLALAADPESNSSRPNILFCMADDWGWPHAGAYGDKVVETPTFDRLAEEGLLFEHAFVSSPSCTPSRNATITGQQFYRLGEGANLWSTLNTEHDNFMFMLRDAGYEIGHCRKAWGPGNFKKGGYTESPCGPKISFGDFLNKRDLNKPFCFWFGTSDPHRGYRYGSGAESGINIDKLYVPKFFPDTEKVRNDIADYYFEVQRWDRDVGDAIALLEKNGELENTIIVMTGDHGMPFPRCKGNLYDWGARVPLAIRWGKINQPKRNITDFVSLTDIAPTVLEAADLEIPGEMTGRSLLPIFKSENDGRVEKERDFVVYGRERHTPAQKKPSTEGYPARAIRTNEWLLILNLKPDRWPAGAPEGSSIKQIKHFSDCDDGPTKTVIMEMKDSTFYDLCFAKRPAVELYDTAADPDNVNNLASDPKYQQTIDRLRNQLVEYLKKTGDPRFTDEPVLFDEYPYRP